MSKELVTDDSVVNNASTDGGMAGTANNYIAVTEEVRAVPNSSKVTGCTSLSSILDLGTTMALSSFGRMIILV